MEWTKGMDKEIGMMNHKPVANDDLSLPLRLSALHKAFYCPSREFGFMPFWFWNDDLNDAELVRQIREFHAKGFGGFIAHPRNGLSRQIGYLTPEFFRLMHVAVDEAARLGMKVILYDEAGYPSGSCQGRVVAENPDWAARPRPRSGRADAAAGWYQLKRMFQALKAHKLLGDNRLALIFRRIACPLILFSFFLDIGHRTLYNLAIHLTPVTTICSICGHGRHGRLSEQLA